MRQGEIVEITWDDATGEATWTTRSEVEWPDMQFKTIGYFWKENDRAIMLMTSLCEDWQEKDGTIGGMCTIPKGMITNIKKLGD